MRASPQTLSMAGLFGLVTGLSGPVAAAVMLAWPPQIAPGPLSYPFTRNGFFVAQTIFFLHHIGLVIPLCALASSGAMGERRWARGGAWVAFAGMLMLTFAELNTMRFAEMDAAAANAGLPGATYGIATNLIGIGMLIAGAGVLRAHAWSGWRRWMPLAIGIATFVELTPGMFGGYVIARLAIGFWILLFAALGQALRTEAPSTHILSEPIGNN
jgi:hypothetical protein